MADIIDLLYHRRQLQAGGGSIDPARRREASLRAILDDTADLIELVLANRDPATAEQDREALKAQAEAIREMLKPTPLEAVP